jgi:hypothetical protein
VFGCGSGFGLVVFCVFSLGCSLVAWFLVVFVLLCAHPSIRYAFFWYFYERCFSMRSDTRLVVCLALVPLVPCVLLASLCALSLSVLCSFSLSALFLPLSVLSLSLPLSVASFCARLLAFPFLLLLLGSWLAGSSPSCLIIAIGSLALWSACTWCAAQSVHNRCCCAFHLLCA